MLFSPCFSSAARNIALAVAATVLLAGCLISPGKFVSDMTVKKDGSFSFSYKGEVFMLGMSKLMQMGAAADAAAEEFAASCYDDQTFENRDCTAEETEQQRADWDAAAETRKASKMQQADQMKAMMGGLDPTDPKAVDELIARLTRQSGWNNVTHKGDGVFEIDFAITTRLDYAFAFPMIEQMQGIMPFVTAVARKDNSVRIEAPAFALSEGSGGMGGAQMAAMMGAFASMGSADGTKSEDDMMKGMTLPEGTFTIRTDGEILANNTDEGAKTEGGMKVLRWDVSPRSKSAPTALIGL